MADAVSSTAAWPPLRRALVVLAAAAAGSLSFYSFVLTPVVFARIENPARGEFLAAIFPSYFLAGALLAAAVTVVAGLSHRARPSAAIFVLSLVALVAALTNQFLSGPVLAELGAQIRIEDITDPAHPLKKAFGRWHGISQSANLLTILGLWGITGLGLRGPKPEAGQIPAA